jgi:hypothetical protein
MIQSGSFKRCQHKMFVISLKKYIQGVFEVEAFLLTCDCMRCSKEF